MTTFFNGGNLLTGILFNSGSELLTLLSQSLPQEGWQIVLDEIASDARILLKGLASNGHECFVRFSFSGSDFIVQGDLDGTGTFLSPVLSLPFSDGEANRFFMPCDNSAGIICLKGKYFYNGAISFGFLRRKNKSDRDAIMVAKLNYRLNDAFIARSLVGGQIWASIGSMFRDADVLTSADCNGAYQGVIDQQAIPNPYVNFAASNLRNAGYLAQQGGKNKIDGRQILTNRFYLEGNGSETSYSNGILPTALRYRGDIAFAINGFGSSPGGEKQIDQLGRRWLSTGSSTEGWQAIMVEDKQFALPSELPTVFRKNITFLDAVKFREEIANVFNGASWDVSNSTNDRALYKATDSVSNGNFYLRARADGTDIILQGDPDGRESTLSPEIKLPYADLSINKIWHSLNQQAGVISVKKGDDNSFSACWFGFLRGFFGRFGIGYTNGADLSQSYIYDPTLRRWRSLDSGFVYDLEDFSSFPISGFDRKTVAGTPARHFSYTGENINSGAFAFKGARNPVTGQAELSFFPVIEGASSSLSYGINIEDFAYLGTIYFLATGGASLSPGQVVNSDTGAEYMSSGGEGWQFVRVS